MDDFIHGDKFAAIASVSRNWPEDNHHLELLGKTDQIIFCKIDFLQEIFDKLHDNKHRHVLITHNSDIPVDYEKWNARPPCIKKWFAQNCKVVHEDLIPIPIGLQRPKGGVLSGDYPAIQAQTAQPKDIINLVYMNHTDKTNPLEREPITRNWGRMKYVTHQPPVISFKGFLKMVHSHDFVLSPQGNIECDAHRTWEAIYLGTIPIVKRSVFIEFFSDLPMLIVDNWTVLSEEELKYERNRIRREKTNLEKSRMSYWANRIEEEFRKIAG
jgi:hypothetical protein